MHQCRLCNYWLSILMCMYRCEVMITANYNILTFLFILYEHVCNFNGKRFVNV